jgi:hypothetical protein
VFLCCTKIAAERGEIEPHFDAEGRTSSAFIPLYFICSTRQAKRPRMFPDISPVFDGRFRRAILKPWQMFLSTADNLSLVMLWRGICGKGARAAVSLRP